MRRRLLAVTAAVAFAASGIVVGANQAQAAHSCMPESPCYPHICIDYKQKPYITFCGG